MGLQTLFQLAVLTLFAVLKVTAQVQGETGPDNSTTPTVQEGEVTVHIIQVGNETNQFVPNSIIANPRDIVMFQFFSGNHSVIQSLYGWPCMPRIAVDGTEGFFSGFFPQVDPNDPPTWNLTISDTSPIWFYCGLIGSCVNWGMLGVINPGSKDNITAQIEIARQTKVMIEPNQTFPADEAASVSSVAIQILELDQNKKSGGGLSGGAIAGIVVGSVVGAALIIGAALFFLIGRRRTSKKKEDEKDVPHDSPAMQNGHASTTLTAPIVGTNGVLPPYQQFNAPQELKDKSPERHSSMGQQPQVALVPVALASGQQVLAPMQIQNIVPSELSAVAAPQELPEHARSPEDQERGRPRPETGPESEVRGE